jgi:hypothetical protein
MIFSISASKPNIAKLEKNCENLKETERRRRRRHLFMK